MVALKKMQVTVNLPGAGGSKIFYFKSNPLLYANITAETGISLAPTDAASVRVEHRIEDLLLYGILVKKAAITGTTATNKKATKLLVSRNKQFGEADLIGKSIPAGTISSISADLRAEDYL
jgi:hypothetical protein